MHTHTARAWPTFLQAEAGASVLIRNLTVNNEGWVPTPLTEAEATSEENGGLPEAIRVRGFRFDKRDHVSIRAAEGERWVSCSARLL